MDDANREVLVADVEHANRPVRAWLLVDGVDLLLGDVGGGLVLRAQHGRRAKERGRIKVDAHLQVDGFEGVWALGDCALVPDSATGGYCPPTAQHASREGKVVAHNIVASVYGKPQEPFSFKTIGLLAAIGRRTGVARIFGVNFSGFLAWFLWRGIYWSKLPRIEKKVRVAIDWALDVFFSKDFVQYLDQRALATSQTETGAAPWNRDQLSDPSKSNNRIAA
jgi:NADH dehydrogenase